MEFWLNGWKAWKETEHDARVYSPNTHMKPSCEYTHTHTCSRSLGVVMDLHLTMLASISRTRYARRVGSTGRAQGALASDSPSRAADACGVRGRTCTHECV